MSIAPEFPYALPPILEVGHVAHTLRLSAEQVRRLIRTTQLPAFKIGHNWRVYRTDLEAFLEARQPVDRRRANAPVDRRIHLQTHADEAAG